MDTSSATTPTICRLERLLKASLITRAATATQIAGSRAPNQTFGQNESLSAYRTANAIAETGNATVERRRAVEIVVKLSFVRKAIRPLKLKTGAILSQ